MEDLLFMLISLVSGILFLWYSQHEKSIKKTAAIQGEETAQKKFKIIKICGYLLIVGSGVFGMFFILDI